MSETDRSDDRGTEQIGLNGQGSTLQRGPAAQENVPALFPALQLAGGFVLIYNSADHQQWLKSDHAVALEEVQ